MGEGPAVLVTGAAGYVGRLCVAALAKRLGELSALVALDWTEIDPSERIAGVVYAQDDICDPALKDVTIPPMLLIYIYSCRSTYKEPLKLKKLRKFLPSEETTRGFWLCTQ